MVVRQLLERADIYAKDKYRRTTLQYAARWGQKIVVRLLLDERAGVDAKDEGDETALHEASQNGYEM